MNDDIQPAGDDADAGWFFEDIYYVDPAALMNATVPPDAGSCVEPQLEPCQPPPA